MSNFKNRDIISIKELDETDILHVLKHAESLKKNPKHDLLGGQVMGSCFFEPSTRTRLSFETAMQRLGGRVVGFADPNMTSTSKGETVYDSIKIIGQYVDVIAMRHPLEGAARRAAEATDKPILNGGDGANQHPTQTLLDLFTIKECQNKLTGLKIAMVGDLRYGRTVHSLLQALKFFQPTLYFVAPNFLQMPDYLLRELDTAGIEYYCKDTIDEVIRQVDILYMTRIQKERFSDITEYEKAKSMYILDTPLLRGVKPNMRVLHPLPRVGEITSAVDNTPHAYYFQQAENGLYARQALLGLVLGKLN